MASEHAGNNPYSDDNNDEGLNVELDTNVPKLRMTRTNRDYDEPAKESVDPISEISALAHLVRKIRARFEADELAP